MFLNPGLSIVQIYLNMAFFKFHISLLVHVDMA
jgi:hypothetical protein